MNIRKEVESEDFPNLRACTKAEAIRLTTYMQQHIETGKLNRNSGCIKCKQATADKIYDVLEQGATELDIDVNIHNVVMVTQLGTGDALVKF